MYLPGFITDYFRPKQRNGQPIKVNYPLIIKISGRMLLQCLQTIALSDEQEDEYGDVKAFRGINGMIKLHVDMTEALLYLESWKGANLLLRGAA